MSYRPARVPPAGWDASGVSPPGTEACAVHSFGAGAVPMFAGGLFFLVFMGPAGGVFAQDYGGAGGEVEFEPFYSGGGVEGIGEGEVFYFFVDIAVAAKFGVVGAEDGGV